MVRAAQRAEQAGFPYVQLSDHFHPWIDRQGQSPFVWSVIGAIAATTKLTVGTGVTCPLIRTHPAIVAQAAATSSVLLDGRFFLGVGLISTIPDREIVAEYDGAGGAGKPRYIEVQVCWGRDPGAARRLVHELWPTSGLGGQLAQEIRRPADFEAAAEPVTLEKSTK